VERNSRDQCEGNILVFAYVDIRMLWIPVLRVDLAPAGFRTCNLPKIGLEQSCWALCSYEQSITQNCLLVPTVFMSLMRNIVETDKQ